MMCFRYRKLLVPYSEGGLDARTRARVERHLGLCKSCAADLRAIQSVRQALTRSDNPAMEPAPDLWAKVNARITEEPIRRDSIARTWALRIAPAAAAAVLMAVVASSIMRPHPPAKSGVAMVAPAMPLGAARVAKAPIMPSPETGRALPERVQPAVRTRPAPQAAVALVAQPAARKVQPSVVVAMARSVIENRPASLRSDQIARAQKAIEERLASSSPAPASPAAGAAASTQARDEIKEAKSSPAAAPAPSSSLSNGSFLRPKGADEAKPFDRDNSIIVKGTASGALFCKDEGAKETKTQTSKIEAGKLSAAKYSPQSTAAVMSTSLRRVASGITQRADWPVRVKSQTAYPRTSMRSQFKTTTPRRPIPW